MLKDMEMNFEGLELQKGKKKMAHFLFFFTDDSNTLVTV